MASTVYDTFITNLDEFKKANDPFVDYSKANKDRFVAICEAIKSFNQDPNSIFTTESLIEREVKIAHLRSEIAVFIENLNGNIIKLRYWRKS